MTAAASRRIALLAFADAQALDLVGPLEVFDGARVMSGGAYTTEILAGGSSSSITTSSGLTIKPGGSVAACRGPVDTLIVVGGPGVAAAEEDETLVASIRSIARRSRRVASVCNGALLLARAGLLDGRRATTHWAACDELARRYPQVAVERDPIFVRDGHIWTSAGVSAGMDLALALVEEDLGREVALEIARWMVLFVQRPGGQAQFSVQLAIQRATLAPLPELQAWIAGNLRADLRVEALAKRAGMSPRGFARAFRREVGVTPAAFVETNRVESACRALAAGAPAIDAVAEQCGFGTPETMRRAFQRRLGVSPADYRARFRAALEPAA